MLKKMLLLGTALWAVAVLATVGMGTGADDSGVSSVLAAGQGGVVVVAQDGSGDYTCIQGAIDDFSSREIIVMPGTYTENILITKDITIKAYDGPLTTVIDGSMRRRFTNGCGSQTTQQDDVISVNPSVKVLLNGLCVTNGQDGVYIRESAQVKLQNCVFWANDNHGVNIMHDWPENEAPTTTVYNCIIVDNGKTGLLAGMRVKRFNIGADYYCPPLLMRNTIILANGAYGIAPAHCPQARDLMEPEKISLEYNCYVANLLGNYGCFIGPGEVISEGQNSFSQAPYFVNGNAGDFRQTPDSPCVDAGAPGAGFMDPDGTTNDIGAYGGPGAATFFDNPIDGPMVRELTVTPGAVPQGAPLTIRAVGSVR